MDTAIASSRISAEAVLARCSLWLRSWQADTNSKRAVEALPVVPLALFGPELDKWIAVATGGKNTFLPTTAGVSRKLCDDHRR